MLQARWQFWLDVGGTFTDCLAKSPSGQLLRRKVLSSGVTKGIIGEGSTCRRIFVPSCATEPDDFWTGYQFRLLDEQGKSLDQAAIQSFQRLGGQIVLERPLQVDPHPGQSCEILAPVEAPVLAIRLFLGLPLQRQVPPVDLRLGTTRGTNALLTRSGSRTAFVTTKGLADVLEIGYQNRPNLFELAIHKPRPLYETAIEIDERLTADGSVLKPPDERSIRRQLEFLKTTGIESLAICLLHAYANGQHEAVVERIARDVGFDEVSVSHRVSPLMKIVSRGDTTVVDAYLNPVLRQYIERLQLALPGSDCKYFTSAGGLVSGKRFTGKESVLSGPAGGVIGMARVTEAAGISKAIGFDMGGTSTDVSRFDGRYEYEQETEKAGVRIVTPMLAVETVAAGGGSICRFDGVRLVVGPASAGADPGPACYGRGGPLTITDCNLHLGRIVPEHFPFPLSRIAVTRRLEEVAAALLQATGQRMTQETLANGFLQIVNASMAQAIRSVSIAKGCDPRDYTLVPFGAAGPQHACAVARELGIRRILLHPDAGVLSALGIGLADVVRHKSVPIYKQLDSQTREDLQQAFDDLEKQGKEEIAAEGVVENRISTCRSLDVRYLGMDAALSIPQPQVGDYSTAFAQEHLRLYGYVHEGRPLEIVAARVVVTGTSEMQLDCSVPNFTQVIPKPCGRQSLYISGEFREVPVFRRSELSLGSKLQGPAILVEELTTTIIDPGWNGSILSGGELELVTCDESTISIPTSADPIFLEVLNNHFTAIASQMGITLRNTSSSVNVKERLDFSCAIFTPEGDLVVNAPHIPVHLGAMGETVKCVIADNPLIRPGDVFVTNDPFRGGSHLPDVTVITPVFVNEASNAKCPGPDAPGKLAFFTANRAHHAEIGGITPGSMPPFSRNLAEEGVLIRNFRLFESGISRLDEIQTLLLAPPYPTRAIRNNLADITAQVAANRQGMRDLLQMVRHYTLPVVTAYMRHIQAAAEQKMRGAIARLAGNVGLPLSQNKIADGQKSHSDIVWERSFTDHLDDGTPIQASCSIRDTDLTIDFTGTGALLAGNLNANRAIVTAAVMYCLRLLIGEEIPLNQGVLVPVQIILSECLLNPPEAELAEDCPAVVGGNVETSQRIVDVLLGALDLAAASQGTMNNLLFGDNTFGYYETICGGSGATPDADGASAVHTHMTNTRITDPEVLERRYPVRLHEFSIRRGSGGSGQKRGGDGIVRRIEFLRPLTLSILSQRRGLYPPYGLHGGQPGALGQNSLLRANGDRLQLPGQVQLAVEPGDIVTIATPGGGGWGLP